MAKISFVRNATSANATPTLKQSVSQSFVSATDYPLAFASDVSAGNVVVVGVMVGVALGAATISITDSNGGSWTQQGGSGNVDSMAIFTRTMQPSDTGTLTVTAHSSVAGVAQVLLHEFVNLTEVQYDTNSASNIPASNPVVVPTLTAGGQCLAFSLVMTDANSTFTGTSPAQTNLETQSTAGFSTGSLFSIITTPGSVTWDLNASVLTGTGIDSCMVLLAVNNILTFAENNGGDTLVAVFAAVSGSADFVAPPSLLTDSNGNVYTLASYHINALTPVTAVFTAMMVYICNKCVMSTVPVTLNFPAELYAIDNLTAWGCGIELQCAFATFALDVVTYNGGSGVSNFDINQVQTGTDNLSIAGVFDSGLSTFATGAMTNPPNTPTTSRTIALVDSTLDIVSLGLVGIFETLQPNEEYHVGLAAATDTFGFALSMSGANATGGSAAETLTFSLNKGPDPLIPIEGRAIATVQIDCTQQQSHLFGLPLDYPEWSCYGDIDDQPQSAVVIEFDLEHLFQGSGLSEVRTLIAWSRPAFTSASGVPPREDSADTSDDTPAFPAMLTNTTTLQTIILGGHASTSESDSQSAYGESLVFPFPANKHSLKYRFICPQSNQNSVNPLGKFTLQFCNWEVPPIVTRGLIARTPD